MSRPRIELGSQELASCAITARPPQHDTTGPRHRAFDVFQGSCYTILLPSARHPARTSKPSSATSVTGIQLEAGAREETGRFRDVKDVSRPRIELGSQELASCAITARPPQHDTTGPRHRAFDVFQGSCYKECAWSPSLIVYGKTKVCSCQTLQVLITHFRLEPCSTSSASRMCHNKQYLP